MTAEALWTISFVLGLLAYLALAVFATIAWTRRITGRVLVLAAWLTLAFIIALALAAESAIAGSIGRVSTRPESGA
jgi:hypothetical protein